MTPEALDVRWPDQRDMHAVLRRGDGWPRHRARARNRRTRRNRKTSRSVARDAREDTAQGGHQP